LWIKRVAAALLGALVRRTSAGIPHVRSAGIPHVRNARKRGRIDELCALLTDPDEDVRIEATRALGEAADLRALAPLKQIAADEHAPFDLRAASIEALGRLKSREAVGTLLSVLGEAKEWSFPARGYFVRQVAKALGSIGGPDAVAALVDLLQDGDYAVVEQSAVTLAAIGDPAADEPLLRRHAVLSRYSSAHRFLTVLADALAQLRSRDVGLLIEMLHFRDEKLRSAACRYLGRTQDAQAVGPLIRALGDEMYAVREAAAVGLVELGEIAIDAVLDVLGNGGWSAKEALAGALGGMHGPRVLEAAQIALRSPNPIVRNGAVKSLGKIGGSRAEELLVQNLGDGDDFVRKAAAQALQGLGWTSGRVAETERIARDSSPGIVHLSQIDKSTPPSTAMWLTRPLVMRKEFVIPQGVDCRLSPDGFICAVSVTDSSYIALLDIRKSPPIQLLSTPSHSFNDLLDLAAFARSDSTEHVRLAAFSPDGRLLAVRKESSDAPVDVWDLQRSLVKCSIQVGEEYSGWVAMAPRDQHIALWGAASDGTGVDIRDMETGQRVGLVPRPANEHLNDAKFSPDGKVLATSWERGGLSLWSIPDCRQIPIAELHNPRFIGWSATGSQALLLGAITTSRFDRRGISFIVWDADSGESVTSTELELGPGKRMKLSPDGRALVVEYEHEKVQVLNPATGQLVYTFDGLANHVQNTAFSPDSRLLAIRSLHNLMVCDLESGQLLHRRLGCDLCMGETTFTSDGYTLVTSEDSTVKPMFKPIGLNSIGQWLDASLKVWAPSS
jgi:HEAT repeat protein/WD40 repeat protein